MPDRETVAEIRERYPWASWAIWNPEFPDGECTETNPEDVAPFIADRHEQLTVEVVLTGLNRSDELAAPFVNFHAPTRKHYDYRLKEFIQDDGLQALHGAYMTDLVDTVDADSSRVEITETDAATFLEQLQLLGGTEYHVVCFGNEPFQGLTDYSDVDATELPHELRYARTTVDGLTLHLYRCWFYGLYGANQEKVEILRKQLQQLNDRISG